MAPHEKVSTTSLASLTQVPDQYLAKVLQQLALANLIKGHRGVTGGFSLTRTANEITLLDVIRAVDKIERIASCPLGLTNHGDGLCSLHRHLDEAAEMIISRFGAITLQQVVDGRGNHARTLCDETRTTEITVSGTVRFRPASNNTKPASKQHATRRRKT
jgi:Rrf2 family protein